MKKNLFSILTLAIMMFFGACSNEELFEENNPVPNLEGRTLSITASMPDEPATRVALEQKTDKTIALTWEVDDVLQFVFVQGETKMKNSVTLTADNITNEGKKAVFNIVIPEGINETAAFDLYGVYGGGDISGTVVSLPSNAGNATSLENVQTRKDVMLYFETKIDATNKNPSVTFQHLGSLFSITLKNSGTASLDNLQEAQLVGINNTGNENWAYNATGDAQTFDLATGKFQNLESAGNQISFKAAVNSLPAGDEITFWSWNPPLPGLDWPELQLQLRDVSTSFATSSNTKAARTAPTAAGKAYYFYATWDGAELAFADESFGEYTVHVQTMGTLSSLLSATQKANIKKLTVTGEINSDDFNVMSSNMPNLMHIDLKEVACKDNKIPDNAFFQKNIRSIVLPDNVTAIGQSAFYNCSNLTGTLTIPANVTSIGGYAFSSCSGFTGSLTIPANVTSIGEYAFFGCSGFTGNLIIPENVKTIGQSAFSKSGFTGTLTLPNGLTTIEHSTFYMCRFTGPLTLPAELITVGDNVFYGCYGFTGDLIIPDKVTTIGNYTFQSCGFNGSLTLSSDLKTIGLRSFYNCSNISGTVIFPISLTSIEKNGFNGCNSIVAFQFLNATPVGYTTSMLDNKKPVIVPTEAAVTAYKTKWGYNKSRHVITAAIE